MTGGFFASIIWVTFRFWPNIHNKISEAFLCSHIVGMIVNSDSGWVCKRVIWGHIYNPVQGHEEPEALIQIFQFLYSVVLIILFLWASVFRQTKEKSY